MANLLVRILLFLSSYSPLLLIFAYRDSFQSNVARYVLLALAFLSVSVVGTYVRVAGRLAPHGVDVKAVTSRDGDAMSYIVTYLLPFLDARFSGTKDTVSLAVVLFILGVLYVNSNMIYTNPVLNLIGFHIFDIEDQNGKRSALITRRGYVRTGALLSASSLGDYVLLERPQ